MRLLSFYPGLAAAVAIMSDVGGAGASSPTFETTFGKLTAGADPGSVVFDRLVTKYRDRANSGDARVAADARETLDMLVLIGAALTAAPGAAPLDTSGFATTDELAAARAALDDVSARVASLEASDAAGAAPPATKGAKG